MASLKVAVRVRPFNQRENEMGAKLIVEMDGKKTSLLKPSRHSAISRGESSNDFTFDYSYWSYDSRDEHYATQDQVFDDLGTDVVDCAFQGYNACVFAYGQTGSGKTFTMMGSAEMQGLIPRICRSLFGRMKLGQEAGTGYKTQVSYLEIYNERVKDLLGEHTLEHGLRVREHRTTGPYVENLSQHPVADYEEIQQCMIQGNNLRTTASTNMNDTSSRSHAIFTITFVQAGFHKGMPSETVSKIHLVDLAGSERANATGATGQRLKEGAHINKSLVTLGSVISALAEQNNPTNNKRVLYVPYRDSILTWLLKDSLGGNSKTIMIAAISPADCNYSETLSTLRYANRAKNIINKPTINEDPHVKLIRELRDEILRYKSMLVQNGNLREPSLKVLEDLQKKEAQEKVLTEEWTEKWREAHTILREEKSLGLRKSGVGVILDSEMPHLIGIHDDISTGVTLYSLKEGITTIGNEDAADPPDIVLDGVGIYAEHCHILLENGNAVIHPNPPGQCFLNGNPIEQPTNISQGDILLLGTLILGTNMFRYNNPVEAAKLRKDHHQRSRLDMSRLSLVAASRENLNTSIMSDDDNGSLFSSPYNNFYKNHSQRHLISIEQFSREDSEIQDEHKKILETIENALKQLNIERSHLHDQYKEKVKRFTEEIERLEANQNDKLEIIECKVQELLARREMVLWEKSNEKTQVDIIGRQVSAIQTQLDSKKRDFYEFVAKELQELQDCGKLDEININIINNAPVTEDYSEVLLEVSKSLDNFSIQYLKENVKKGREVIETFEKQLQDKEDLLSKSTQKMEEIDLKLSQLEEQNQNLLTQKSQHEIDLIQMKKQSLSLDLKKTTASTEAQTDALSPNQITDDNSDTTLGTYETFHTANSDCSFVSALPSPVVLPITLAVVNTPMPTPSPSIQDDDRLMSDSGVSFETNNKYNTMASTSNHILNHKNSDDDNLSSHSSTKTSSSSSEIDCKNFTLYDFNVLRQKIAAKKAEIMSNLESEAEKEGLNAKINELQELQKQFVKIEIKMQEMDKFLNRNDFLSDDNSLRDASESIPDSDDSRLTNLVYSAYVDRENKLTNSNYTPTLARSLPSIDSTYQSDHIISIPSYIIRGAGKQTHYEYEVRICLPDDRWVLLRRYSRFRELHLSLKSCYGEKINAIPFPRRELFASNKETIARLRRRQLETYLRRLLVVCSKLPQSPIYEGVHGNGINKITLCELSTFFKKGLFETGKHGTG